MMLDRRTTPWEHGVTSMVRAALVFSLFGVVALVGCKHDSSSDSDDETASSIPATGENNTTSQTEEPDEGDPAQYDESGAALPSPSDDDQPYDVIDLAQFDDACGSDDDCALVASGRHCGKCMPPCELDAISKSDYPAYKAQRDAVECTEEDLEIADQWECEACIYARPKCIEGQCQGCYEVGDKRTCK